MDRQAVLTQVGTGVVAWAVAIAVAITASGQTSPYQPPLRKPTADELAAARQHLAAGHAKEALAALDGLEPTEAVLRLRIDGGIAVGRIGLALDTYDQLERLIERADPEVLASLAHGVLDEVIASGDPLLSIEACRTQAASARSGCLKGLAALAGDANVPTTLQAQALSVAASLGDRAALARLHAMAASLKGQGRRAALDAARLLPANEAEAIFIEGLSASEPDLQYSAAAARQALEKFLAGAGTNAAKGAAALSLAALGDEGSLKTFTDALDTLAGGDLLRVGDLLVARGDPRGVAALERVARGDHALLRVRAGARLSSPRPEVGREVMVEALQSENPWVRAAALEEYRSTTILDLGTARRALADGDPWVRLRAAAAVLDRVSSPGPATATRKPSVVPGTRRKP